MPLSFLVPGYVQKIFGPGLSTGRYYAFILSLLILAGAVIIGLRLVGKWGGAITAVLLTFNPAALKIYSMVFSEGLTAFLLIMTLVLILGKDRPLWQILTGSFLAGLIPVTRINLIPVLPLVIIYLFWEHGTKKGIYGLLVSSLTFLGIHLIYWPGILDLWVRWIPEGIRSFLHIKHYDPFNVIRVDPKEISLLDRFQAVFQVIRMQFPAVFGVFTALCLWPKKWTDQAQKRTSEFLMVLFCVLFFFHLGAAIIPSFNVFAFFRYVNFFYPLGVLLVIGTWQNWNVNQPIWKMIVIGAGIIFAVLGIGIGNSEASTYYGSRIIELLQRRALSFENGQIVVAPWKWWETLKGQLGWEFSTSLKVTGIVLFFISGLVILAGLMFLYDRLINSKGHKSNKTYLPQTLVLFLVLGIILSPTEFLGGGWDFYDCQSGVFDSYQDAANQVSNYVENGDQIFWVGVDTQIVLLELLDMKEYQIYPQQLNAMNSFRLGGDSDPLTRIGFWNDELAQEWVDGSQVLMFEDQALTRWFGDVYPQIDLSGYEVVGETSDIGCTTNQRITVYRKK